MELPAEFGLPTRDPGDVVTPGVLCFAACPPVLPLPHCTRHEAVVDISATRCGKQSGSDGPLYELGFREWRGICEMNR
jgi:hypothetical protein